MKYYKISFPGECGQHVEEIWSEKQIFQSSWYRNWVYMMVQADRAPLMTEQNALDDWIVVHWAVEVPKPDWITEDAQ